MTTGQRIQQARKKAGLSQKQLGEKLGLSASMIGQWENDLRNPKYETLQRIADALDVHPMILIDYVDYDRETIENASYVVLHQSQYDEKSIKDAQEILTRARTLHPERSMAVKSGISERVNVALSKLNHAGQQEAVKRVEELTEIPRYRVQDASPAETPTLSAAEWYRKAASCGSKEAMEHLSEGYKAAESPPTPPGVAQSTTPPPAAPETPSEGD